MSYVARPEANLRFDKRPSIAWCCHLANANKVRPITDSHDAPGEFPHLSRKGGDGLRPTLRGLMEGLVRRRRRRQRQLTGQAVGYGVLEGDG